MSHGDQHSRISEAYQLESGSQSGRCHPLEDEIHRMFRKAAKKGRRKPAIFGNPQLVQRLLEEGFSYGLANVLLQQSKNVAMRVWLIDNSGSMNQNDGHRPTQVTGKTKISTVNCTRWEEVRSTVMWHANLSAIIQAPIVFRLLNDPGFGFEQQFTLGLRGDDKITDDVQNVEKMMSKTRPTGPSNLVQHLKEVHESLEKVKDELYENKKIVTMVIVTDGIPTNEFGQVGDNVKDHFINVLQQFSNLPVWIVIRLATDDTKAIEFYNNIDQHFTALDLDLNIDVLDDWMHEALEVYEHNPWVNYTLPLHLSRESGITFSEFDALDERPLSLAELKEMCSFLFEMGPEDNVPDPRYDWHGYVYILQQVVKKQKVHWNPVKERLSPWIDFRELNRIYGGLDNERGCLCEIL